MEIYINIFYLIVINILCFVRAFPESANPIMITKPLNLPVNDPSMTCSFVILTGSCSYYNEVTRQTLLIPETCQNPNSHWEKVVIEFNGAAKGVQFDRTGTVWLGDIEILRTTTAEPTFDGVSWSVTKDISDYRDYIWKNRDSDLETIISIPNNIDETYTAAINVLITMTIYLSSNDSTLPSAPYVIPLTKANKVDFPWDAMTLVGTQNFTYDIILPFNATELYVDVLAEPHGCDEFYYSNSDASISGVCGGGVYREVQVYVDNYLAGSMYHFPVVYTGGVCPLLWRPISGIMSFSISPKRYDLTPFLHFFNDGKSHNISFSVFGNNENDGGFWYLSALLLMYDFNNIPDSYIVDNNEIIKSELFVNDMLPQVTVSRKVSTGSTIFDAHTQGYHFYDISRVMTLRDGSTVSRKVVGKLAMFNDNSLLSSGDVGVTNQRTVTYTLSSATNPIDESVSREIIVDDFPMYQYSYYVQDDTTFDINGTVDYTYDRIKLWNYESNNVEKNFFINIRDHIYSNASYNRSLSDHLDSNYMADISIKHYGISVNNNVCYSRLSSAMDGYIDHDYTAKNKCKFPDGLSVCSYDTCGTFNTLPEASLSFSEIDSIVFIEDFIHGIESLDSAKSRVLNDVFKRFIESKSSADVLLFLREQDQLKAKSSHKNSSLSKTFIPFRSPLNSKKTIVN